MIKHFLLFVLALWISDYALSFITINYNDYAHLYEGLFATALILYVCNYIVIPILRILTFPITLITFGVSSTILGSVVTYYSLKLNPYLSYTSIWGLLAFVILLNAIWWILSKIV